MRVMLRHMALMLALLLSMATPLFAVARAQVLIAGPEAVLCIGGGMVSVRLDADGKPAGPGVYCPEVLSGLAAVLDAPVSVPMAQGPARDATTPPRAFHAVEAPRLLPPVRAPPLLT